MSSSTDTVTNTLAQGTYLSQLAGDLLLASTPATEQLSGGDGASVPLDSSWIKQSFMIPTDSNGKPMLSDQQLYNLTASSADLKFTDASLGGNTCINPPPQFTRYADVRRPGVHLQGPLSSAASEAAAPPQYVNVEMSKTANYGMGRYYSEAIDDNNQIIHLRFGVPQYNSLLQFFTGFYDSGMASVARTGRISGSFISRFLSTTGNLIGLAIAPLFIIPMAIMLLGTAARFFMGTPPSKFYYSKPVMPMYWTAVTQMVNQIGTNMGLISYIDTRQSQAVNADNSGLNGLQGGRSTQKGVIANYLPDGTIREDGLIDVKKIACRAKVLEEKYRSIIAEAMKQAGPTTRFDDALRNAITNLRSDLGNAREGMALEDYLQQYVSTQSLGGADSSATSATSGTSGSTPSAPGVNRGGTENDLRLPAIEAANKVAATAGTSASDQQSSFTSGISTFLTEVATYFTATLADGSDWVSFRVDYTGSIQESFSNSTAPSALADKINSASSQSRSTRLSLADGNLAPGIGDLVDGVKDLVGGVAEVLHLDGFAALAGSAFVDIPASWESSRASLPKTSYTMTLISPYGNPISQMMHIWIPLSMLLCGALPLATGAQSHTSPLLCELHDRGRWMTRLGMIGDVSITRGSSNLGFNNQGHCLAVDVSFSIQDLSSIMAVPVMPSFDLLNPLRGIFDSDNAFSDYLMTLAAMPLADVVYKFPMLKYQINKRIADYKAALTPSNIGSNLASLPGMSLLSGVMRGVTMK